MLTAAQRPIAMLIRYAVHFVDPDAEVILYGSQARGEADKWSDWDVVVIRQIEMDDSYWEKIVDAIYEVELATGEIITATVVDKFCWKKKGQGTLFRKNVLSDGIALKTLAA